MTLVLLSDHKRCLLYDIMTLASVHLQDSHSSIHTTFTFIHPHISIIYQIYLQDFLFVLIVNVVVIYQISGVLVI